MRRITAVLVVALTLVAGAGIAGSASTPDQRTVRDRAIAWLAPQVTADGAVISAYTDAPDASMTAQAALAFAGAGAVPTTVAKMIAYLEAHVNDYVAPGGAADDPGALSWLILDAVATGGDPTDFGGEDLVARLRATQQSSGLFGSADATYDGAFRQGLALLALRAVGEQNPDGLAWLQDQQCADGGFVAFRSDTSVPCPAIDPASYVGEDTNSTAMAAMALSVGGDRTGAAAAMTWFGTVRTADGGFPFLGDPTLTMDANSTGLVALAFQTVEGVVDAGSVAALESLQVPESGDAADRGGIAFQAGTPLTPDAIATIQALQGLAGQGLPFVPVTPDEPTTSTSTPSTSTPSSISTSTTVAAGGTATSPVATPVSATPTYTG